MKINGQYCTSKCFCIYKINNVKNIKEILIDIKLNLNYSINSYFALKALFTDNTTYTERIFNLEAKYNVLNTQNLFVYFYTDSVFYNLPFSINIKKYTKFSFKNTVLFVILIVFILFFIFSLCIYYKKKKKREQDLLNRINFINLQLQIQPPGTNNNNILNNNNNILNNDNNLNQNEEIQPSSNIILNNIINVLNHNELEHINENQAKIKMTKTLINNYLDNELKGKKFSSINDKKITKCTICIEDFQDENIVSVTPCNHIFHFECIKKWMINDINHIKCPLCNHQFIKI
jgi:cbb3-type cytochrome oxidase subunit 3